MAGTEEGGGTGPLEGGTPEGSTLDGGTLEGGTLDGGTLEGGTLEGGTLEGGGVTPLQRTPVIAEMGGVKKYSPPRETTKSIH